MKLKFKKIYIILAVIVGSGMLLYFLFFIGRPSIECFVSGGNVVVSEECRESDNFKNSCLGDGACAPQYRTKKIICQCQSNLCFNGTKCVTSVNLP
jgi:hypothetical protein